MQEHYPFNYESMSEGHRIEPEELEALLGVPRTSRRYSLMLVPLVHEIERNTRELGNPLIAKIERDGISVLTAEEATDYTNNQFCIGLRKAKRSHFRSMLVNRGNLSEKCAEKHDRRLEVQGKILQAVAATRKELALGSHQRTTPTMKLPSKAG